MPIYRQIAHRLRLQGRVPEESERPRERDGRGCYHDEVCRWTNHKHPTDAPPTLLDLDAQTAERLLRIGAIVPWVEPRRKRSAEHQGDEAAAPEGEASGG